VIRTTRTQSVQDRIISETPTVQKPASGGGRSIQAQRVKVALRSGAAHESFVLQEEAGQRAAAFPLRPPIPAEPPPLRFGQSRLTIPNTCSTITVSASLRSDAVHLRPECRSASSGIDVHLHRNTQFLRICSMASYSWLSILNAAVFKCCRLVRGRYGLPPTSTDVPVINCERPTLRVRVEHWEVSGGIPAWHQQCCALLVFFASCLAKGQLHASRY